MITNMEKTLEMGKRVYNSKMIEEKNEDGTIKFSDAEGIKALCSKVFTKDGEVNNMEDLRSFNKMIVEVANFEAQARFEQIVNAVSEYKQVGRYDKVSYLKVPQRVKTTAYLSASATAVDFVKIPKSQTQVPAVPKTFQFGAQYSISEMVTNPVNAFRDAVNNVVEAKLSFIFKQIMALTKTAVASGKTPASQQSVVANMTLASFRAIESKLLRVGRNVRPVMIADVNMINALKLKEGTEGLGGVGLSWLTDEMRNSLMKDITFDMVSKTICIPTDNPFIDETNTITDLDPSEAIILAGGSEAPFKVTEYGALRSASDMPSIEKEQVLLKLDYTIDITLFMGRSLAYINDTSILA